MVEAGIGVSALPKMATPDGDHPTLVTRAIGNPVVSRTIGIVRRRGALLAHGRARHLSCPQQFPAAPTEGFLGPGASYRVEIQIGNLAEGHDGQRLAASLLD